jgi:Ca-activated chloride channel homolog
MKHTLNILIALFALCAGTSLVAQSNATSGINAEKMENTNILFVFDASNSMNAFWEGERKIHVATELLSQALTELHGIDGLQLALRVYGHQTKFVKDKIQDCDDTELLVSFGSGNNLIIKKELGRLQARGTTPIARSLERAADDFPEGNGRNVIILITDGIEACDEDPCAVSKALQARGIIVKPFIIGIGLEKEYKETFRCVGNFFDATDPEAFAEVLDIVIEQAIHDTTYEIDLVDGSGKAQVANLAVTWTDEHSGMMVDHFVHTLNYLGRPDTLHIDPIPTYTVRLHTLPALVKEGVHLEARKHNHVVFEEVKQGWLTPSFAREVMTDYGELQVDVFTSGSCERVYPMVLGERKQFLEGAYDLVFQTKPAVKVEGVVVREGQISPVSIPVPGTLLLNTGGAGYGGIFTEDSDEVVYRFDHGDPSGRYILQPGEYRLIYRSRAAQSTEYARTRSFTIRSGRTSNLEING